MSFGRRSRTQSVPFPSPDFKLNDDANYEADDEISSCSSRRPSVTSAPKTNLKSSPILMVNSTNNASNTSLNSIESNQSRTSLIGSIYSLGGTVWNFIRGPVETDSNDEILSRNNRNSNLRHRSKSFSVGSSRIINEPKEFSDDAFMSDSSEAPDFTIPVSPADKSEMKNPAVEPGKNKIIFDKISTNNSCNLIGREFPKEEHLLSLNDICSIHSQMPTRWNVYTDWILLYSTRGNGFSLTTLYHQLRGFKGPIIISVKDEFGAVFGAFLNQSLHPRSGHYGNGECFLWRKWEEKFIKYASTTKNDYFIISEPDYLAIGCGEGKFGLWLEKELFKGISEPVPTFDNEKLSTNDKFDCIAIEIWGLDLNE